jgi:hypothetical protein
MIALLARFLANDASGIAIGRRHANADIASDGVFAS